MVFLSKLLFLSEAFDFEAFKQIANGNVRPDTIEKQKEFAYANRTHPEIAYAKQEGLANIGQGSARTVFALDNNRVLKIAKNNDGIVQNENEVNIGFHALANGSRVLAEIYDFDRTGFKWLVMERVREMSMEDFAKQTGVSVDIFQFLLDCYLEGDGLWSVQAELNHNDFPEMNKMALKAFLENKSAQNFVEKLTSVVKMFGLNTGDIVDKHFGLSRDGHVKLYDYGYLEE